MTQIPPLLRKCHEYTRAKVAQAHGYYPYFRVVEEMHGPVAVVDGAEVVMAGSNNYLGLTQHPRVKEAARRAIDKYGTSCSGSRFLNGTIDLHIELEDKLARFMGKEAALVFSTGFQTNLGIIPSLAGKGDTIYTDRENHASLVDGCRLSFGTTLKFRHNDIGDLRALLENPDNGRRGDGGKLIAVDGIFSMLGDVIDLPGVMELAREHEATVLLDDAHGIGVMGATGRGTAEHFGLLDEVHLVMGTFSKSFASLGGFVAGDQAVIDYIKHHARAMIFSAAMPPASIASVCTAIDVIDDEPELLQRLWQNTRHMKAELDRLGFDTGGSETPVIPIVIGDMMRTILFWRTLLENGVFTNPVIAPAVPPQMDLIRTSYMATHQPQHLDRILEVCEKVGREMGMIDPSRPTSPTATPAAPATPAEVPASRTVPAPSSTATPEA